MKSKRNLCIMALALFLCSIVPVSALAGLSAEPQTAEDVQHGKPWVKRTNDTDAFEAIRVPISSTGATNAIRYRATTTRLTVHGHTATYNSMGTEVIPGPGQTIKQTVVIDAESLAQEMGVGKQQVEDWLNIGDVVQISSTVEIYQGNTVLGTYNDYASLAAAMQHYGFPQQDIQDAATRWGDADDPSPPQRVNLKIDSLGLYTTSGQYAGTAVKPGSYILRAVFTNESSETGQASFYAHRLGPITPYASYSQQDFAPGSTTKEWTVEIKEGTNLFEADVDYPMDSNGNHVEEPFIVNGVSIYETDSNGQRKYNDNTLQLVVTGDNSSSGGGSNPPPDPPPPPSTGNLSVTASNVNGHLGYKITSTFNVSGPVKIHFYKIESGSPTPKGGFTISSLPANGNYFGEDTNISIGTSPVVVAIGGETAVSINNDGQYASGEPLFSGAKETRYDDNVSKVSGSNDQPGHEYPNASPGSLTTQTVITMVPDNNQYPLWEPVTLTPMETEVVHHVQLWKKVKFYPAPRPEIHVQLLPHTE